MPRKGKAVVAINYKGEIIGAYGNVAEAAQINGSHPKNIYKALKTKTYHRKVLWMWEEDYREYWMTGRTDELRNSYRRLRSETVKRGRAEMSEEKKEQWKRKLSLSRKRAMEKTPGCMPQHKTCLLCVTTGEVFDSIVSFARKYNVQPSAVSQAARLGYRVNRILSVKKIKEQEYDERRSTTGPV